MADLKKRNSNFELLRILAMLMIIAFHMFNYCFYVQLTDEDSIMLMGNGVFCNLQFYRRLLLLAMVSPLGKVGNAVFLLISGYFLVSRGSQINLIKITKKLLLQLGFSVLVLVVVSGCVYRAVDGSVYGVSIYPLDISMFNKSDWFVGYYLGVIVIAALFLNRWLGQLEQKKYLTFLLVIFALVEIAWTGEMVESLATGLRILATGVFLYALGGYISLYRPFERVRGWVLVLIILVAFLLIFQSFYQITMRRIDEYVQASLNTDPEDLGPFVQQIPIYKDYSILPILMGVSLFELFRRIRMPSSSVINFMGAATFMIYLLHDNNFVRSLWKRYDWITLLYDQPGHFLLKYSMWVIGIFLIGMLLYGLYALLCKLLPRCIGIVLKRESDYNK